MSPLHVAAIESKYLRVTKSVFGKPLDFPANVCQLWNSCGSQAVKLTAPALRKGPGRSFRWWGRFLRKLGEIFRDFSSGRDSLPIWIRWTCIDDHNTRKRTLL